MKRVKFVSGFNAKMALVACAVAGFTLTGCEKEEFTVQVPNITVTVPEIEWPETKDGVAYLLLSASSSTGEALAGVTYSIDGVAQNANVTYVSVTSGQHTITAEKEGYYAGSAVVMVPELPKDAVLNIPVNIVLNPVNVDDTNLVTSVPDYSNPEPAPEVDPTELAVTPPAGGTFPAGEVNVPNVPVPTADPFLSNEQKNKFYTAIDKYISEYAVSRAATEEDLQTVKSILYAKVASYNETANTVSRSYSFTISEAASSITVVVKTAYNYVQLTITAVLNGESHAVTSECTVASTTTVSANADGVNVGHGHAHGGNDGAGGGIIE